MLDCWEKQKKRGEHSNENTEGKAVLPTVDKDNSRES